jgi:ABC-2 type transport system ATP-binding protein
MTAIRIEGLQKIYGGVRAVDGLNLTVEEGAVFGFLGPNGAGKTTTIRMLTGLAHPSGGQAWVAGAELAEGRRVAHRIGYLPEEPAFYGWMSPLEFMDHVGRLFGLSAPERKARSAELLELAGLSQVSKRRIAGFSRGMRQRLGLAQALVNRPEVLLLDEPVSALDPAGRKEVLEMIEGLRGKCTVFMSTHILADVERVCDTVGIIDHGKLIVEANQQELLARYTLPAFELECDPGHEAELRTWANRLTVMHDWITQASMEGCVARLLVNDMAKARPALMALAARADLALRRYEMVTPSLEDVFLRLMNGEAVKQ